MRPDDRADLADALADIGEKTRAIELSKSVLADPTADHYDLANAIRAWFAADRADAMVQVPAALKSRPVLTPADRAEVAAVFAELDEADQAVELARSVLADPAADGRDVLALVLSRDIGRCRRGAFVLHERDGGKVADGGGLCHVTPAGEFQSSSVDLADVRNDFSLWRNIMREFSEELLGNPEHDGSSSHAINYAIEEPFRSFEKARQEGRFRVWHYGLVVEPLELGAAQLTVAVIDADTFVARSQRVRRGCRLGSRLTVDRRCSALGGARPVLGRIRTD